MGRRYVTCVVGLSNARRGWRRTSTIRTLAKSVRACLCEKTDLIGFFIIGKSPTAIVFRNVLAGIPRRRADHGMAVPRCGPVRR